MITSKYTVSIEFTPNEQYNSIISEKLYIKTSLGNMLNPKLSNRMLIQLNDLAYTIDEIRRISENEKQDYITSTLTFDTDYGYVVLKIKKLNSIVKIINLGGLVLLTASIVFALTYFLFK